MARKALVLVDLSEVIHDAKRSKSMYDVFSRFTLSDMIEQILAVDPYIDYSQHVYDALESRFDDDDVLDMELFGLFFEYLTGTVDTAIKEQYIDILDRERLFDGKRCSWIFVKWIDNTTALIRLEN